MTILQMQGSLCSTRLKDLKCDNPYDLANLKEHYCPAPFGAMPAPHPFDPFNPSSQSSPWVHSNPFESNRFPDLLSGFNQTARNEAAAAQAEPRTSARLERLEQAKAKLQASQLDLNALDEFVNFTAARKAMDESIAGMNSAQDSAADYVAQAARAGKDFMLELGESAYEAAKAVPKLGRMVFTNKGRAIAWLEAQILAENIRLGNTTASSAGEVAMAVGAGMVKPTADALAKGQYVEAGLRGAELVLTGPGRGLKGLKGAQGAKALGKEMRKHEPKCFKKNKKSDAKEYDRQLADQEKGLNNLTVKEYLEGRAKYEEIGRKGTGAAQEAARADYSKDLTDRFVEELREQGIKGAAVQTKAASMAAEKMKTLAALHNPDMIAGGKDVVTSMGDKGVNSSIGSQWKDRVSDMDKAAREVPESERSNTNMNTKLKRCF